jgi:predicted transcriptional regulator
MLSALDNPHRLRILASLSKGRNYVSQLAREIKLSRPLLHIHLKRLEAAGLIAGSLELSEDGKAMKYYEVVPFSLSLTPEVITKLATSLSNEVGESA